MKWQDTILENIKYFKEIEVQHNLPKEEQKYTIVSDGWVYDMKRTFCVIISDGNHPLISNQGKMYGVDYL